MLHLHVRKSHLDVVEGAGYSFRVTRDALLVHDELGAAHMVDVLLRALGARPVEVETKVQLAVEFFKLEGLRGREDVCFNLFALYVSSHLVLGMVHCL